MVDEEVSNAQGSSASRVAPAAAGLTRTQTTTLLAAGPAVGPPSSVSESGNSRTGLRLPVGVDGPSPSSVSSAHSEAEVLLQREVSASTVEEDERGVGRAFVVILAAASAPLLVGRTMLIELEVLNMILYRSRPIDVQRALKIGCGGRRGALDVTIASCGGSVGLDATSTFRAPPTSRFHSRLPSRLSRRESDLASSRRATPYSSKTGAAYEVFKVLHRYCEGYNVPTAA